MMQRVFLAKSHDVKSFLSFSNCGGPRQDGKTPLFNTWSGTPSCYLSLIALDRYMILAQGLSTPGSGEAWLVFYCITMAAFKLFAKLAPKPLKSKEKNKPQSNPTVVPKRYDQQLQLPPGRSIFDVFPNEIIIEHMPVRDKDSFSRCSTFCYKLSFPLRRSLVLTPESIEKFQDGGVCQHLRGLIQSIRFGDI